MYCIFCNDLLETEKEKEEAICNSCASTHWEDRQHDTDVPLDFSGVPSLHFHDMEPEAEPSVPDDEVDDLVDEMLRSR